MAKLIQAIARYGPRVIQDRHVRVDELAELVAVDVGVNRNVTRMILGALSDAILHYLRRGSPVVVPGLGRLRVTVGREMDLRLHLVPEAAFRAKVVDAAQFTGKVANAARGGWTDAQYKAAWDAEFPGDPLEVQGGRGRP